VTAVQLPPFARRLHQLETDALTRQGEHCGTRGCREPITVVGWYHRRTGGQVLGYERFLCTAHGEAFAARHHLDITPPPTEAELADADLAHLDPEPPQPQTFLYGMSAAMLADHEAEGWTCDWPRCRGEARYFSGRHYQPPRGKFRRVARFLCVPHARRFAAEHGIDFTTVTPPEGGSR
jgi:hypothetical protein